MLRSKESSEENQIEMTEKALQRKALVTWVNLSRDLSHVTKGKSCDSQSFPGRGGRECKVPEMGMCLVGVEQQERDQYG